MAIEDLNLLFLQREDYPQLLSVVYGIETLGLNPEEALDQVINNQLTAPEDFECPLAHIYDPEILGRTLMQTG